MINPSSSAPRATASLTVEHGWNPAERASFWFTMVRIRPVAASTTTTLPLKFPRARTAAARTTADSPLRVSSAVELAVLDTREVPLRREALRFAAAWREVSSPGRKARRTLRRRLHCRNRFFSIDWPLSSCLPVYSSQRQRCSDETYSR